MVRLAMAGLSVHVLFVIAQGNAFLGHEFSKPAPAGHLLEQLEQVLGSGGRQAAENRVDKLEKALQPTFQAMPKGKDERVEAAAVRYLLHRLFVDRHGWYVRGLETEGEAWNSSSPAAIFQDGVGSLIHGVFEEHLGKHGFSLHDVAVLAATLESFVHAETMERLTAAYYVSGIPQDSANEEQVLKVMDTYMLMYVLAMNHTVIKREEIDESYGFIDEVYPHWDETKQWVRHIRQEVVSQERLPATSFSTTIRVLEEMSERYGRWQDRECHIIKDSLVNLEQAGTGRVPLTSFYASALNGTWQFGESKNYLKQLGALDESDSSRPSVIIPNYVNSPTNCVASSKFYSVCCINECEALLNHLEQQVAAPEATPKRIVELVESLPSSTVQAPRSLPGQLVERLEQIAAQHDGAYVPFHGRLFNQWLHHAYPRECPYPHLSGTSKPVGPELWKELTGEDAAADEATMRWHVQESTQSLSSVFSSDDELPWSAEEELFVSRPSLPEPTAKHSHRAVGGGLMLAAAASSVALTLFRMSATGAASVDVPQKYVL